MTKILRRNGDAVVFLFSFLIVLFCSFIFITTTGILNNTKEFDSGEFFFIMGYLILEWLFGAFSLLYGITCKDVNGYLCSKKFDHQLVPKAIVFLFVVLIGSSFVYGFMNPSERTIEFVNLFFGVVLQILVAVIGTKICHKLNYYGDELQL